jgi:hypothetical protein
MSKEVGNKMIGHKTRVILGSMVMLFLLPSILGFICSRVYSGYWEMGGLIREGSALIPAAVTRMHTSALFEIMLICLIVVICGVGMGLLLTKRPLSAARIEDKTNYKEDRK